MSSSYVIVPNQQTTPSTIKPDVYNNGLKTKSALLSPHHPLENRLSHWDQTQENFKLNLQRDLYGSGLPLRLMMERNLIKKNNVILPGQTKSSNFHLDILLGKDELINESDVFLPNIQTDHQFSNLDKTDFHSQIERKLNI